MQSKEDEMSLRDLKEVRTKLPPEGQKWLDGMDIGELHSTQDILHRMGEETFLANWNAYKEDLDQLRLTFESGPRLRGWLPEHHL
jgi:hypothetical protein